MAINIGRVGIVNYPTWQENKEYETLDRVRVENIGVFSCLKDHIATSQNKPLGDSEFWMCEIDFADINKIHTALNEATENIYSKEDIAVEHIAEKRNEAIFLIKTKKEDLEAFLNGEKENIKTQISNLNTFSNIFKSQTYTYKPLQKIKEEGFLEDNVAAKPNEDGLYDVGGALISKQEYEARKNISNFLKNYEFYIKEYHQGIDWNSKIYREMWVKLPTQTIKYIPKYGDILYSEYGAFEIDDGDATVFIKDDERFSVYRLIKGCLYPFIYTKTMAEYLKNSIKFEIMSFEKYNDYAQKTLKVSTNKDSNGFYQEEYDYADEVQSVFFPMVYSSFTDTGTLDKNGIIVSIFKIFGNMSAIEDVSRRLEHKEDSNEIVFTLHMIDASICEISFSYTVSEGAWELYLTP